MTDPVARDSSFPIRVVGQSTPTLDAQVEDVAARTLGQLSGVLADGADVDPDQVQYWMFNGVTSLGDPILPSPALRYELTIILDSPVGFERAKTAGHSHGWLRNGQPGFAEVCEVMAGEALFVVQDLVPGPSSRFVALITATAGQRVVLPPVLTHATLNSGHQELVFSDVVDRRITADYAGVSEARGMAYYLAVDGEIRPNPRYVSVPAPLRLTAGEWCEQSALGLYEQLRDDSESLDWLIDPARFPTRQPRVWQRVSQYVRRGVEA